MWGLNLNPALPIGVTDGAGKPLGEGHAILLVDYGLDDHSYFVVVMDDGPVLWVKTENARRARNWSAGHDPDGIAGRRIAAAMNPNSIEAIAEELSHTTLACLERARDTAASTCGEGSLAARTWARAIELWRLRPFTREADQVAGEDAAKGPNTFNTERTIVADDDGHDSQ